jgi:hypothetical protein
LEDDHAAGSIKATVRLPRRVLEVTGIRRKRKIATRNPIQEKERQMPKYLIEREIPGAGNLGAAELQGISQQSCAVLSELGPEIQWVQSYVTDNKVYCVYIAPNEELVREHAKKGGFPANSVSEVKSVIDPTTAEG